MNNQTSKIKNHAAAIRTIAAFSGLEINTVIAEFERRFEA